MIEIYSKNVTVESGNNIPLDSVVVLKGSSVTNSGDYELIFNQCGVYKIDVTASVTPSGTATDGVLSIGLIKEGIAVPQATSAADDTVATALSFSSLVQVNRNNTPCVCSSPVVCSIQNTGVAAVFNTIDVVVTKVA